MSPKPHFLEPLTLSLSLLMSVLFILIQLHAHSLHAHSLQAGTGCDPLISREGLLVDCINPSIKAAVDCHDHGGLRRSSSAKLVPVGTVANYSCDSPIYLPSNSELTDHGDRTLTCNSRGKWTGLQQFHLHSCTLNCGVTDFGSLDSFVVGGLPTKTSDWPWHATIFSRLDSSASDSEFSYICGGSLIKPFTSKEFLVVTAAHCVATADNKRRPRRASDVVVALGSEESSLDGFEEHSPHGRAYKVKEIVLHESYGGLAKGLSADIALIRLSEPVVVKPNVLPICLSKSTAVPAVGADEVGHIVGFGLYEHGSPAGSIQLRRASFPVVSPDKCFEWRSRKLATPEFCAGTNNLQNACNGDSGGGMVFNGTDSSSKSRFYLHGIVSHGRVAEGEAPGASCDTYAVYTKVSNYIDWIYSTAEKISERNGPICDDGSSPRSHISLYRPGTGTIWILKNEGAGQFSPVYQQGDPGRGIGQYDLKSGRDQIFTFDYDKSGIQNHLVLIRPGTGTIWILKHTNKGTYEPLYREGDPGAGIGGYDLRSTADRGFAFDYDSSGRADHLVLYRPGTGGLWILKHEGGSQFTPVYKEGDPGKGIGGYDLKSASDLVFPFDYDGSGKADHLVLYRPGAGKISILKNSDGKFSPVYETESGGIGGYDLKSSADRMFAFDYESSGKLDHLVLYRPRTGTIWILRNHGRGSFVPVYREGDPGRGIGGYDLRSAADRLFAYDYDGTGRRDHLVLYRPGTGGLWILKNDGGGQFTAVYKEGDPGNGIGGYDLRSRADRAFAYSYCTSTT